MGRPPPKTLPPMTPQRPDVWGQRLRNSQYERYVKDEVSLKAALGEARRRQKTFGNAHGFSIILTEDIVVKETVVLDVDGLVLRTTSFNALLASGGLADLLQVGGDDITVHGLQLGHATNVSARPSRALVFEDSGNNQCLRPRIRDLIVYAVDTAIAFECGVYQASIENIELRSAATSIISYSADSTIQYSYFNCLRSFINGESLVLGNSLSIGNHFHNINAYYRVYVNGNYLTLSGVLLSNDSLYYDGGNSSISGCTVYGFTMADGSDNNGIAGCVFAGSVQMDGCDKNAFSGCHIGIDLALVDSSQNAFSGCYVGTSIVESGTSGINAFIGITGTPALTLAATSIGAIGTNAAWNTPAKPAGTIV